MNITRATEHDIEAIISLYKAVIEQMQGSPYSCFWDMSLYPTKAMLEKATEKGEMLIFKDKQSIASAMVLNHEGTIDYSKANWKIHTKADETLIIHLLAVNPKYRGKGLGKAMLEEAERQEGIKALRLDVIKTNLPAIHLYESCGFMKIAETCKIKAGSKLEFLLYEKAVKSI